MLGVLAVMFALLIWGKLPAWLVFMGTLTAAMTLKLASAEALLTGFSNAGVLTVAALFPVAAGMFTLRLGAAPTEWLRAQRASLHP
jgi:hypothetical protein